MGSFSLTHILVLVIIIAIFMGPQRLPELGKSMGKAINGFKKGLNDEDEKPAPHSPTTEVPNKKDRSSP